MSHHFNVSSISTTASCPSMKKLAADGFLPTVQEKVCGWEGPLGS